MTENEAIEELKLIKHTRIFIPRDEVWEMAIKALEEIQQYRAIGTVEQLEWCKDASHWKDLFKEKLEQYEAIGTIGEFKALKEKNEPKKPIGEYTQCKCSVCGRRVRSGRGSSSFVRDNFCQRCGQKLDWGE